MLMIFQTTNLHAQSTQDTLIKLKPSVARKLLIDAEKKDILENEVANLNARIAGLQYQIDLISNNDSTIRASYERELVIVRDQKNIAVSQIKALEKQLKRSRRTTRWTAIAGIVLTAGVKFLIK